MNASTAVDIFRLAVFAGAVIVVLDALVYFGGSKGDRSTLGGLVAYFRSWAGRVTGSKK
jgi:hypothetical protein